MRLEIILNLVSGNTILVQRDSRAVAHKLAAFVKRNWFFCEVDTKRGLRIWKQSNKGIVSAYMIASKLLSHVKYNWVVDYFNLHLDCRVQNVEYYPEGISDRKSSMNTFQIYGLIVNLPFSNMLKLGIHLTNINM